MSPAGCHRSLWSTVLACLVALALPAAASAADPAAATITACRSDSATVAGTVVVRGSAARRVRGATLQLRFQVYPLFGMPRAAAWKVLGPKTRASARQVFTGLSADNWIGAMSWRYMRGRRTVLSGRERSQPMHFGHTRGKVNCTIVDGAKPVDTNAPSIFITPSDEVWHRAPASVRIAAQDGLSGVARVQYSIDGGPATRVGNGAVFTIPTEGAHRIDYSATDVAGNTATKTAIVRVDAAPPTKPVVTGPASITGSRQPTITWKPSSDSGSGVRGYIVAIRRADGSTVAQQAVDASTTSFQAPALDDGQPYSATITAIDNTDQAWGAGSDPYSFRVDTNPDATFSPASVTVLTGNLKNGPFTITLDRAADPKTVSPSTVALVRGDGTRPNYTAGCANNACTAITVSLTSPTTLPEGRYTLSLSGVKSAAEGLTFSASASYAVPFPTEGGTPSPTCTVLSGGTATASKSYTFAYAAPAAEQGRFTFDWSVKDANSWSAKVYPGTATSGNSLGQTSSTGGSPSTLGFNIPAGTNGVTLVFTLTCATTSSQLTVSNLTGTRLP